MAIGLPLSSQIAASLDGLWLQVIGRIVRVRPVGLFSGTLRRSYHIGGQRLHYGHRRRENYPDRARLADGELPLLVSPGLLVLDPAARDRVSYPPSNSPVRHLQIHRKLGLDPAGWNIS